MCGFLTFFSNKLITNRNRNLLHLALSILKHRGPDEEGIYSDDNVFFGFRRLSIIDLDNGQQPFSYNSNQYQIVFNGEIYNYVELREDLIKEGYKFSTNSEAEVILTAYYHYGEDFIKLLRGMFAFVIWDKVNQKLFAARDPFGIKPLFYTNTTDGFYCASESKILLPVQHSSTEVNYKAFHDYLTFQFVPEPNTMYKNIHSLESGCILKKEAGREHEIKRYSHLNFFPKKENTENRKSDIRKALEDSVTSHMRSDVPVATFLSGGIDSTIVTALASKINSNIKTFTVGFEVDGYSEIELAQETAYELGVNNINIKVTPQEFIEKLPNIIWHMDSPVADPAAIPLYFICREARKHVKVVLSGEGSDELFGGYNIYHEPISLEVFSQIPKFIKKLLKQSVSFFPEGMKGKSFIERGCTPIDERYFGNAKIFNEKEKSHIIKNYIKQASPTLVTKPFFDEIKHLDPVTKMQYIDINTWLKGDILVKADRMSMAHSLELRVPFLDKKVFEVASKLTLEDKINRNTTKYLLREAFKEELPKSAVYRRKLGYPVPIKQWLKNELYDWAFQLINEDIIEQYINKREILCMLANHKNGKIDYSRRLWTILTFILWYKIFITRQHNTGKFIVNG